MPRRKHIDRRVRLADAKYNNSTLSELINKFMLSGKIQPGLEGQVLHLIDETPTSLVTSAVKQIATKKNIKFKLLWKNLAKVAADMSPVRMITGTGWCSR